MRSPLTPRTRNDDFGALPVFVQLMFLRVRVTDSRVKVKNLRPRFDEVKPQILEWIGFAQDWLEGADRRIENSGEESVDKSDPAQCSEFIEKFPDNFFVKRQRLQLQIAIAKVELEWTEESIVEREARGH